MRNYEEVPWRAIHDYLLDIESAKTKNEFIIRAMSGLLRLIPVDVGAIMADDSGRVVLGDGFGDALIRSFNEYYRFRVPFIPDVHRFKISALSSRYSVDHCFITVWNDYKNTEFVTDFTRPAGNAVTLTHIAQSNPLHYSLHRSSRGLPFSETDRATLAVLVPHINNLHACFEKLQQMARYAVCEDEVRERFPRVSWREAEIAVLLCRGLSASEIASKLFIGRRTVEWHLEKLYFRLGVRTRRDAISRLTKTSGGEN
jgi:DNA-binding CsgD family transcriptional regulator